MNVRSWIIPIGIGAVSLLLITGIQLAFRVDNPVGRGLHMVAGAWLVAAGIILMLSRAAVLRPYLEGRFAVWAMALSAGLLGLTALPLLPLMPPPAPPGMAAPVLPLGAVPPQLLVGGEDLPPPGIDGLSSTRIGQLALMAGLRDDELLSRLSASGYQNVTIDQTIAFVAHGDVARERRIVQIAFGSQ
ncbi:hypothetical protein [Phaeovulum sp. W22_SRMD_FR3]|uniref:hypothetical protein n=1 Tax=Phaeovulum sp. W22_SRMD_FR3 TaxID=3240274 RepID=UPI003F99EFBF